jgi:hypothetical protein
LENCLFYREKVPVCSEIYTKDMNALCGKNFELLNVKPDGTYCKCLTLKVTTKSTTKRKGEISSAASNSFSEPGGGYTH